MTLLPSISFPSPSVLRIVATLLIASCAHSSWAAGPKDLKNSVWPTRPLRILVGFPGGSTPDMAARTLAEPLSRALGQPVIVENKPGASGNIAADQVAKATDDHTLGVVINGNLTSAKLLYPKLPYDPAKDFALVSLLTTAPLVLVAPAAEPGGAEFFNAARQGGSQWNYGSVGNGSVAHLGMELLKSRVPGLTPVHVPFAGNPQVVTAMLGGQIQMALIPPGVAMPHVRSGKLKAIGLAGGRSSLVPEVPPLADAGVTNVNLEVWTALIGPASLSKAAQARLAQEVPRIIRDADTRQKLFNQGWQAVGTSPDGLNSRVKDEAAILGGIIQSRGIKIE
ncbi:tripartite tricarboxylate transporter substrate-binding protein [Polaromonas sp.]|uniref:Bug family tripartite tricarboxylate transporter substrate binding protein n=1 Tax=Polaromonas sp. TaxID=1869339 RepID=UPI003266BA28